MEYEFKFRGEECDDTELCSPELRTIFEPDEHIRIRANHLGPIVFSRVGEGPDQSALLPFFVAIVAPFYLSLSIAACCFERRRQVKLVEYGIATVGVVRRIGSRSFRRGPGYAAVYSFSNEEGKQFKGTVAVNPKLPKRLELGDAVIVLYDPGRPKKSAAYFDLKFRAHA